MSYRVPLALAIALAACACGLMPKATPNPGVPCQQVYTHDECLAIVALATKNLGKGADTVVAVNIAPEPTTPGGARGAATTIRLRLRLKDGSIVETNVCGGVSMESACSARPRASPE